MKQLQDGPISTTSDCFSRLNRTETGQDCMLSFRTAKGLEAVVIL